MLPRKRVLASATVFARSDWTPKFALLLVLYFKSGPNPPTSLSVTTMGTFTGQQAASDCSTAAMAEGNTYAFNTSQGYLRGYDISMLHATLLCVPAN